MPPTSWRSERSIVSSLAHSTRIRQYGRSVVEGRKGEIRVWQVGGTPEKRVTHGAMLVENDVKERQARFEFLKSKVSG